MTYQYLVFLLDDQRYALHLSAIDRVVRMVHITPISSAPDILLGIVNLEGLVIPVMDVRQRFNLPERENSLSDRLIFARTQRRSVALIADTVTGVIECSEHSLISAERILPELAHVEGVIKFEDGMILIHNLDKFLSLERSKFPPRLDDKRVFQPVAVSEELTGVDEHMIPYPTSQAQARRQKHVAGDHPSFLSGSTGPSHFQVAC